jgi:multiple sugar transport system substrate-binding protein
MQKISRRNFLKVAGVSAAALGLAACGGASSSSTAPASTASSAAGASSAASAASIEPCELTYWYWADSDALAATMQSMIDDFNSTNKFGITVKGEQQNWDGGNYSTTLVNACIGGGGPDVATFKLTATPTFVENDLLYDLTDMVEAWDGKSDISDNLWTNMKYASNTDKIYVMPWNIQVLYVYYRPSYFKAAGIEAAPATYAEFLDDIKKLTTTINGQQVYGFGMRGGAGGQEPWGSFVYANGGTWDDLSTDGAVAGMQDFIDLYTNGYVPSNSTEVGFAEMKQDFLDGRTAMIVHHCGSSTAMIDQFGDDVDAFIFPKSDKGQWTSMGDTENVILSATKNPAAAFEWLKYLATGKGEETWCEASGNVPVSATVQAMDFCKNNKFVQISIGGIDVAGILPCRSTTSEFISEWPNITGQALGGQLSAADACKQMQDLLWS